MLPLDSPRWAELTGSASRNGESAARRLRDGPAADFVELYHQACHQLSVGEVAYAIVPHVIQLARTMPLDERMWPLITAGTVAACRIAYPDRTPTIPTDLRADYEEATAEALQLAAEAIGQPGQTPEQSLQLLGAIAGLLGHGELAIQLLMSPPGDELACPACGERLSVGRCAQLPGEFTDSAKLHDWVARYNWDDGLEPMWVVAESRQTERATALMIYWRLGGPWLEAETGGVNSGAKRLQDVIRERVLAGFYPRLSSVFDPRSELSKVQIYQLLKDGLPEALLG